MRLLPLLFALVLAACATTAPPPAPAAASAPAVLSAPARKGVELGDLDRSAKPCDDFFEFANGAWRRANPIPGSMDRWSRRWQAGETNKERLKEILDDVSRRSDWPRGSVEQLVSDYYGACMDQARVDGQGASPLGPLLGELEKARDLRDVQRLLRRLHELQVSVPFAVSPTPDQHQPTRTIASVGASGLGLPDRDYYLKPEARFVEARQQYRAHVSRMFQLLGRPPAAAREAAETVFAFEKRLAEASLDNVALRDPKATDHLVPFAELARLAPHLDWAAYFDEARLPREELNVEQPRFLEAVDRELQKAPVAVWRTYLTWQLLGSAAPWLSQPFVDESFAFYEKYLGGVAELKPRWKRCAESTDELLGEALGQKYVERYFPPQAKARALEMVKNELAAMGTIIRGLAWMTPATKAKALEKLATFNPKIGYPDRWLDYSSVVVTRGDFWADLAAARRFNVEVGRSRVGKPTDRGLWGMTPPTSNAYYNPLLNEVVFPAGILQPPAFDVNASDAVNYGAIGVVIGHEISHGFDDQGAQYDGQGRLQNWWGDDDLRQFRARGQCVVDQFEGYFIEPGIHHQGQLVLGESIGDLAGVRVAWLAFEEAQRQHPETPADGFTAAQEFFVAWGQFRGDETRPETQRKMVQGDPHPVARFRVVGPLSNLPVFREAFACAEGAPMVRPAAARCEVW
jgi:putative endopeptidase